MSETEYGAPRLGGQRPGPGCAGSRVGRDSSLFGWYASLMNIKGLVRKVLGRERQIVLSWEDRAMLSAAMLGMIAEMQDGYVCFHDIAGVAGRNAVSDDDGMRLADWLISQASSQRS